jgi:hypothetical protein
MKATKKLMTMTLSASMITALVAGCSSDNNSTAPGSDNPVSAEDLALATTGTTLVRTGNYQVLRTTGNITNGVTQYRTLLGALNPNTAGELPTGRREINWDGVPAAVTDVDNFPASFFNVNSPRGVIFATAGSGFRVSSNGYTDVRADFAGEFNTFSPTKLFVSLGSATMDVNFFVAGSNTPALVTGFGSVFGDVGRSGKTSIQYFDASGKLLASVSAPAKADATGLSFVGVVFDSPVVARVRIIAGEAPLSATAIDFAHGAVYPDLVVMDDFIYGEPHAIK